MSSFIVLMVVAAVILLVLDWITNLIVQNKTIPINSSKAMDKLCYYVTFYEITRNMQHYQIYTQKGYVRAPVSRKIDSQYEHYYVLVELNFSEFVGYLQKKGIINEKSEIKIVDLSHAGLEFCSFLKRNKINNMDKCGITPESFFNLRSEQAVDIPGVYILYNKTKQMYYVGQSIRLFSRINQHFTGHGNGDVYADYKYGDQFLIKYISLKDSGFKSLDALEKAKIAEYDAYNNGYNKTSGNR